MLTVLLLTACSGDTAPAPTAPSTEPPTQLHTVAPAQDQPDAEWAHIDGEMTLEDADNIYAQGSDFLSFALVVSDGTAEIRFKLDDVTASMLRTQSKENRYYLTLNNEKIGSAVLNENCDEATLVGEYSYEGLCTLSNRIRGLE